MGDGTGISWTDATWNPVRGCSRVSEGCRNCYAETLAARFCGPGQPYEGLARRALKTQGASQPRWTGEVRFIAEHLGDPLRWKEPRRIFVNSMSDLFHEKLTDAQIVDVFAVMALAPRHTFQVLTKRARRMCEWFTAERRGEVIGRAWSMLGSVGKGRVIPRPDRYKHDGITDRPWPLPNVWLGVSVENQDAADERIPEMLDTPAVVRFLSCEPLLGEVSIPSYLRGTAQHTAIAAYAGLTDEPGVDWVIAGCESGHGARSCGAAWLRSLRDQCAAAGVAYFLKQAENPIVETDGVVDREDIITIGRGSKRKAGRVIELPYLDGVQHAAFPTTSTP